METENSVKHFSYSDTIEQKHKIKEEMKPIMRYDQ